MWEIVKFVSRMSVIIIIIIIMLHISRFMDLGNICISSFCLIDKLSFSSISIFSLLLYLPISSSVSPIIKDLCSSSSYSFHFHHLSFNGITKEAIPSQNMINPIGI